MTDRGNTGRMSVVEPVEGASMWALTGSTQVFGVLGYPVGHSLSPAMHNAALRALGLDAVYVPFTVRPEDLPQALRGLAALNVRGVNVTIPHKEAAFRLVDEALDEAAAIRAVNTIAVESGRLIGHNTDVYGFLAPLHEVGIGLEGARAVVIGAGGAARAVVSALARAGSKLTVVNRTEERAVNLVRELGGADSEVLAVGSAALRARLAEAALVVNATSAGMEPHTETLPPVPLECLSRECVVYDLVYRPEVTGLLRFALERGCRTVGGLPMLVHQGARALRIWTGMEPPVEVMMEAARAAIRGQAVA